MWQRGKHFTKPAKLSLPRFVAQLLDHTTLHALFHLRLCSRPRTQGLSPDAVPGGYAAQREAANQGTLAMDDTESEMTIRSKGIDVAGVFCARHMGSDIASDLRGKDATKKAPRKYPPATFISV